MNKKVIHDIAFFNGNQGSLVFGSESVNSYVKISCSDPDALISLIRQFDGNRTLEEIRSFCTEQKINIDLDKLIQVMSQKGLFEGDDVSERSEIQMLGIKVFMKELPLKKEHISRLPLLLTGLVIALLMTSALAVCLMHLPELPHLFNRELLKYRDSYLLGIGVTLLVSVAVLLLHELGHCLAAGICGIPIHRIGMYLYLGVLPKWFISFRGIRVAKDSRKIFVFCGGILMNIAMILTAAACYLLNPSFEAAKCIIVSNLFMILNCLVPFSLTDGYFIFSTAFHVDNIRREMFRCMQNVRKLRFSQTKLPMLAYILVNLIFWVYKIYLFYLWIWISLTDISKYGRIVVCLIAVIHVALLIRTIRKTKL